MSISRIPDYQFVEYGKCVHRRKRKDLSRRRKRTFYFCSRSQRELYGQKGCHSGKVRNE